MITPNVIIIVVDTLRKDYARPLEEELKRSGFISYENVISPSSWTTPSHASIFTGLYPLFHSAHETKTKKHLKVRIKKKYWSRLISKEITGKGYDTFLLTANLFITPQFGFVGFKHIYDTMDLRYNLADEEKGIIDQIKKEYNIKSSYDYIKALLRKKEYKLLFKLSTTGLPYRIKRVIKGPMDKGAEDVISIMKDLHRRGKNSKFVFINLMEVHEPYLRNEGDIDKNFINNVKTGALNEKLMRKWKIKYPKEVYYVTKKIRTIINILKDNFIFEDSVIIVTSDHGQLLGEHGRMSHGTFLYDELLKVPLLIKYPEKANIQITSNSLKYISLTQIKRLIMGILENKLNNDSLLYSDVVFAESYGIHQNVGSVLTDEERKNVEKLEKYRIAIYYKNFKGILNVTDWKFEEIKSYDPNIEVTEDVVKTMKKEVIKFLKTATVSRIPKIKI